MKKVTQQQMTQDLKRIMDSFMQAQQNHGLGDEVDGLVLAALTAGYGFAMVNHVGCKYSEVVGANYQAMEDLQKEGVIQEVIPSPIKI